MVGAMEALGTKLAEVGWVSFSDQCLSPDVMRGSVDLTEDAKVIDDCSGRGCVDYCCS